MANEQLRVILTLDNGQYKREAKEAASATGQIAREAKETGSATSRMGQSMSRIGPVIKAALVGAALVTVKTFAGSVKTAFVDLNESLNAVEVTYGDAAEGIKKLGVEAAQSLGLSNAEFNGFAVQMSAFAHQIAGDGGDVVGVVDELSTRVSDFASVMNLEVAEAARLFQSGLAGETEPLRRYGIDLSAAAVKAHALAVGISDGTGELSEQEKVLARHSLLMAQTDKTAGDFANTIDELANAERVFSAELENQKAVIGAELAPTYVELLKINRDLIPVLGDVAGLFAELATGSAALVGPLGEIVSIFSKAESEGGVLSDALAFMKESVLRILQPWRVFADVTDLWTDLGDDAADTFSTLGGEMNQIPAAAGAAAGGMEEVEETTDEARTALEEFEDEVRSQTEPMYALVDATNDVAEAQQAVIGAEEEFGRGSPEYNQAVLDLAQAHEDLRAAQIKVAEQSGFTRADFETHLRNMGLTNQTVIDDILNQFDRVNAFKFADKNIRISEVYGGSRVPGGVRAPVSGRQHGGPFERHQMFRAGEQNRPELMIIPGDAGQVFSHVDSRRLIDALTGAHSSGGVSFHGGINVKSEADPARIADAVTWRLRTAGL